MARKTKLLTDAEAKRQLVWRHNSYMGHARMIQMQCVAITKSSTATTQTKSLASQIYNLAGDLYDSLQTRKDKE